MEIGAKLKEAREAQNLSLESIQEITKIQKRYLVAIERGDFHILPGKFYARAFIKEYAYAVGLEPDELLIDHQDEVPSTDDNETVEFTGTRRSRRDSSSNRSSEIFSFMPTVIVVLLVIGIIFIAWTLFQKTLSDSSGDPVDDSPFDEVNKDVEDEEEPSAEGDADDADDADSGEDEEAESTDATSEFSVVNIGTGNSPESTMQLTNVGEEVKVSLEFTGETYLQVIGGSGEVFLDGMYSESDSPQELEISGEEKVYFNIGYSLHVDVKINEVELEYPIAPQSSVHQKLWINLSKAE